MSDIFKEVEEEVRRDQLLKLWKKYGVFVVAVVLAVVLGVAGYQGWTVYEQRQRAAASQSYNAAAGLLAAGESEQAMAAFAALTDPGSGGYGLLAGFEAARLAAEAGEGDRALAIWGEIAASNAPAAFRDAAVLAAARHRLDQGEAAEAEAMLEPLTAAGRPYRPLAVELSGVAALARGDEATARQRLEGLVADIEAPPGTRRRAAELLATIGE